jgi:predicted RNase H-like HicB family nuclease
MGTFIVSIVEEDKFFIARCSALGVTSQGESLEEAQANLKEAIDLYIESFGIVGLPVETSLLNGIEPFCDPTFEI